MSNVFARGPEAVLGVVLLLCGCHAESDRFRPFKAPPLPDVTQLGLPANDAGTLTLMTNGPLELRVDPTRRTPVHTMRACRFWLDACLEHNDDNLDLCVEHSPPCKSGRPWEVDEQCCPAACAARYREHRAQGKRDGYALIATFDELECFPRLAAYRRGEKP